MDVAISGIIIPVEFYVVHNLTQNCILGGTFFEECKAAIDFSNKTLSLYENTVTVPLFNDIELSKVLRTATKLRIPPLAEVIFTAKMDKQAENTTGITEALPSTLGLVVANVLQDSSKPRLVCRMLNTTRKVVYLLANFAFAVDVTAGLSLIDVDAFTNNESVTDAQLSDNSTDLPDHGSRLAYLTSRGIQIGTDVLSNSELQELTA